MGAQPVEVALGHPMILETGYLSSRQVIEKLIKCQAGGVAIGRAERQISKRDVHHEGHVTAWARKF